MDFLNVVFLPYRASFFITFIENCGRGECLRITTFLTTVIDGRQGHAPCNIHLLLQSLFLCQLNFIEIIGMLDVL